MEIIDTHQTIAKIVKNGCKELAKHTVITYSDIALNFEVILNKVYDNISISDNIGLIQSIQNLLDLSTFNDEHQRFETETDECADCVQTMIVTIEIGFVDALRGLDIIDIEIYQVMMNDLPKYNWMCFENALFTCQGHVKAKCVIGIIPQKTSASHEEVIARINSTLPENEAKTPLFILPLSLPVGSPQFTKPLSVSSFVLFQN